MLTLKEANSSVNETCPYTTDEEQYSTLEYWEDALTNKKGDCEDAAIAKFHLLREAGWPLDCFKLGLCWCENNLGYHCVLIVTEDGVDMVLDNRYPYPMPWNQLPYTWDRFYIVAEKKWRLYKKE
jgi:predicted transglutaminase-like cysteine proteinase